MRKTIFIKKLFLIIYHHNIKHIIAKLFVLYYYSILLIIVLFHMIHQCDLTLHSVMYGKNSSHANNKTLRTFTLNTLSIKLRSVYLQSSFTLTISNKTMRTIKRLGGLDDFLIKTKNKNLSDFGSKLKKKIYKIMYSN